MIYIDLGDLPTNGSNITKVKWQLQHCLLSAIKKSSSYVTNRPLEYYRKIGIVKPYECFFTVNLKLSQFFTLVNKTIGVNLCDYD